MQLVIWSTDQRVEVDPLVIGQHVWSTNEGVGVDQLVNWSTTLIQEVEVDEVDQVSRSQLINWSASQGVEVDQLIN